MKILFYIVLLVCGLVHSLPLYGQAWQDSLNTGKEAFQVGEFKAAMRAFKNAQDIAPKGVDIQELVNQSAYKAANYDEAVKGYSQSLKQAKTAQEQTKANYNLGNAQFKNKNVDAAIESYKDALRKDPSNEKARYNLAYAMQQKNKQNKQNQQQNQQNKSQQQNNSNQDQKQQKQQGQDGKNKQNKEPQHTPPENDMGESQADRLLDALNQADKNTQKKLNKKKDSTGVVGIAKQKDW